MGSGTTARVAMRRGVDFLGIEQSSAYASRAMEELHGVGTGLTDPTTVTQLNFLQD